MATALQTIHSIRPATVDVRQELCLVVVVRGGLLARSVDLQAFWDRVRATSFGRKLAFSRPGTQSAWAPIRPDASPLPYPDAQAAGLCRSACLAESSQGGGRSLSVLDLGSALGLERASHLLFRFPPSTEPEEMAGLALLCVESVPLWWGTCGWFLESHGGRRPGRRMAALAKRFWCAQVLDPAALQWDALEGLASVNWLTLIGTELCAQFSVAPDRLVDAASRYASRGVFVRQGSGGVTLAAGAKPMKGDINLDENMAAYVAVSECVRPMMASSATLSSSFESKEIMNAWMHRFSDPHGWLEAEIEGRS
jgi:hypothetical protein